MAGSNMRTFKSLRKSLTEAKVSDKLIKRNFPNVWNLGQKEPKILDMFHKSVDTSNMNKKKMAYAQKGVGTFVRDDLGGGYLDPKIIKKLNLKDDVKVN